MHTPDLVQLLLGHINICSVEGTNSRPLTQKANRLATTPTVMSNYFITD